MSKSEVGVTITSPDILILLIWAIFGNSSHL